ncbi:hypothetical protein CMUS01_09456, partial [Colletotrichum musicola]
CGHFSDALQAACRGGHNTTVRILLKPGANLNARNGHFGGALLAASHGGHDATVRILLEAARAGIGAPGDLLSIALQTAILRGHTKVMATLLREGARLDIDAQIQDRGNALYAASEEGQIATVHFLLEKGADVNAEGGHFGNALQVASCKGHETIVQMLLERGAVINASWGHHRNSLHAALIEDHDIIFWMLVDRRIKERSRKRKAEKALHGDTQRRRLSSPDQGPE